MAGIFRGGSTTLVRESVGNAVFFSVYEYMRYHMHSRINSASDNSINLTGMGIGILSGGFSGVAVSILLIPLNLSKLFFFFFSNFPSIFLPVLVSCFAPGRGKNHNSD